MAIELVERAIPIISLSNFKQRREEIKAQLVEAATELGFFVIVDHGISNEEIEAHFQRMKRFFALPQEVKEHYKHDKTENVGYEQRSQFRPSTGMIDQKESLILRTSKEYGWPSEHDLAGYSSATFKYMEKCHELSMLILDLFEEDLDLPRGTFRAAHDIYAPSSLSQMRQLHYLPKEATTTPYWRNGSHTDISILTLLFQREGEDGLQICPGREAFTDFGMGDSWTAVPARQGPIVCNIGDMMMYWSDDRYKSIFHRVVALPEAQPSRLSCAYFNHAMQESVIAGPQGKYPPKTAGQIMRDRMEAEYGANQKPKTSDP